MTALKRQRQAKESVEKGRAYYLVSKLFAQLRTLVRVLILQSLYKADICLVNGSNNESVRFVLRYHKYRL